ncbi:AsmA family protein [Aestuariirhabdus sp. LZHN29]|uniref:AsmA family protein n=1 Tax=Aestuariirhabdus sp. LZHN29 TaxID=3417462 RepID=UPI003CFAC5FB
MEQGKFNNGPIAAWSVRIAKSLGIFLAAIVIICATIVLLVSNEQYRGALIWGADHFLDSTLKLDGTLAIGIGKELSLSANTAQLIADDGSYKIASGKFEARLDIISSLRSRTWRFSTLKLVNTHIQILDTGPSQSDPDTPLYLPAIIVDRVDLKSITLSLQESGRTAPWTLVLDRFAIAPKVSEAGNNKPALIDGVVSGTGSLGSEPFSVKGSYAESGSGYGVDITLSSKSHNARVSATIADPATGKGLDLKIAAKGEDVSGLLSLFDTPDLPLKTLDLSTSVTGSLSDPQLKNLSISLTHTQGVSLDIKGEVGHLLELQDLNLKASFGTENLGQVADLIEALGGAATKEVQAAPHQPDAPPGKSAIEDIGPVSLTGTLVRDRQKISVDDISLTVGPKAQPELQAAGSIALTASQSIRVQGQVDAATATLARVAVNDEAFSNRTSGKLGRIKGHFNVVQEEGQWRVEKLELDSTGTQLYQAHITTNRSQSPTSEMTGFDYKVQIANPAALGTELGVDFSGISPYTTSGAITIGRNKLNYKGGDALGETESHSEVDINWENEKILVRGKVDIPKLHLSDLGLKEKGSDSDAPHPIEAVAEAGDSAKAGETNTPQEIDQTRLFSRTPFDFSWAENLGLELDLNIDQISGAAVTAGKLAAHISAKESVIHIYPLQVEVEGGKGDLDLKIEAASTPKFTLKLAAENLKLERLIAEAQDSIQVLGESWLRIDIQSQGNSPQEVASNLSGTAGFGVEETQIPLKYIRLLSVDVFGWALGRVQSQQAYTQLNCMIGAFKIDQGVASSKVLVADGSNLRIEGTATIDLGNETIDMVLLPKEKKKFYSSITAVNIKGQLQAPNVKALPMEAAALKVGAAALLPGIGVTAYLADKLWNKFRGEEEASNDDTTQNKTSGCEAVLEKQKEREPSATN